jgi:peptidoglycan/LPS O-acetylase OafA/YrhL
MLDSPMWSLSHEMRISLMFPFLMAALAAWRWKATVAASLALAVVGAALAPTLGDSLVAPALTLEFICLFVVGAVVASRRHELVAWYRSLPAAVRLLGAVGAGAAYVWPNLPLPTALSVPPLDNLAIMCGAAWCIVAVQGEGWLRELMHRRPLTFLGDISFSLYLVHLPILLATLTVGMSTVPTPILLVLAVVVSLIVATIFHRAVEQPAITWSRAAARRLRPAPQRPAAAPAGSLR